MRKKLALFTILATCAIAAFGAQTASAKYVGVYVTATPTIQCQPTPDTVNLYVNFKAQVTAIGTSKPSKVRIGYQIVNSDSKAVKRSGVLNLKRSKGYKANTPTFTANLEEPLTFHLNMSYKAYGKTKKKKLNFDLAAPSAADLQSFGTPPCA